MKKLTRADGLAAYQDFFRAPVRLLPIQAVADSAMQLALKSGQRFYDCLYLALAIAEQARFATADARFCHAMQSNAHAEHLLLLADLT